MKYLLAFMMAALALFLWVPGIHAQTPTPEPPTGTPVVTQIWPGPTRTPIGDLGGCDPALTPNPNAYDLEYRYNCGHCFPKPTLSGSTSTPWPTVHFGSGTPLPTANPGTLTPTLETTPTPAMTPTPWTGYRTETIGSYYLDFFNPNTVENHDTGLFIPIDAKAVKVEYSGTTTHNGEVRFTNANFSLFGYGPGAGVVCFDLDNQACQGVGLPDSGGSYSQGTIMLTTYGNHVQITGDFTLYAIFDTPPPTPEVTLTPTVTPTGTVEPGFCASGSGHLIGEVYSEILPPVYIRDGACLTIIPSLDSITPFIPESWTVSDWSGVRVCLQYVGLGVVKLFGYEVYMLHYLTAGAAVAIIRRIMKG